MKRIVVGVLCMAALVGTVYAANWAVKTFAPWVVVTGLIVIPAGVWFIGPAFTLRDFVHETLGVPGVLVAIALGAVVSWGINPGLAFAASATFATAELLDLIVYTPLRERNWLGAVTASNLVGLIVDSVMFLWLAHAFFASIGINSWDLLLGQILGKVAVTGVTIAILRLVKGREALEPVAA